MAVARKQFPSLTSSNAPDRIQFSFKITCCYISTFFFLYAFIRRIISFNFPRNLHWKRGRENACKNKFSRKVFSFLPPALRLILLNGYVADLIQIFFFFALFSYPFMKLFSLVPPASRSLRSRFPQFSNGKSRRQRINRFCSL